MNITKLFALSAVVTLALVGGPSKPSGLSFTCNNGSKASPCPTGQVRFTGSGYHNHVNVVVTGPNGVIDDGFYQAPGGVLSFTQTLDPAGTYTIETSRKGGKEIIDSFKIDTLDTH